MMILDKIKYFVMRLTGRLVRVDCPNCGKHFADVSKKLTSGTFTCGSCGHKWDYMQK